MATPPTDYYEIELICFVCSDFVHYHFAYVSSILYVLCLYAGIPGDGRTISCEESSWNHFGDGEGITNVDVCERMFFRSFVCI